MKTQPVHDMPEYGIWCAMKTRCYNPNCRGYRWYGARGITVCLRWRESFSAFLSDMGKRPIGSQIERRNNSSGYSPENCIWASPKVQANNKRSNLHIELKGESKTASQWSDDTGIPVSRIYARLNKLGMAPEKALTAVDRLDPHGNPYPTISFGEVTLTLRGWASRIGVRPETLWARINRGMPMNRALTKTPGRCVSKSECMVCFNGQYKTVAQWCRDLDLPYDRTKARLSKLRMPPDVAFQPGRRSPSGLRRGQHTW